MKIEEAVTCLNENGLRARAAQFCDIAVVGDPIEFKVGYHWACWIDREGEEWRVSPPPILTPGPGPQFVVSTLEDAVSLTLYAFSHRARVEQRRYDTMEDAQRMFDEWQKSRE